MAKKKTIIDVKCPCCSEVLEIDVETETVIAHRKGPHLKADARAGEDPFSVAVRMQREAKERADREFLKAKDDLSNESQRLDELFRRASKKAAEELDLEGKERDD